MSSSTQSLLLNSCDMDFADQWRLWGFSPASTQFAVQLGISAASWIQDWRPWTKWAELDHRTGGNMTSSWPFLTKVRGGMTEHTAELPANQIFRIPRRNPPLQLSLWWSTSYPSQSSRSKPSSAAWQQSHSPVSAYWSAWQILMNFS
jgi:hypothetical protein